MSEVISETIKHPKQWQLDYQLEDTGPMGLYQEYSEMGKSVLLYYTTMNYIYI